MTTIRLPLPWAVGQILTALQMRTGINDPLSDLSGDHGAVEFRDSLEVVGGSGGGRYVGLPRSTTALLPSAAPTGAIMYDSTRREVAADIGSEVRGLDMVPARTAVTLAGQTLTANTQATLHTASSVVGLYLGLLEVKWTIASGDHNATLMLELYHQKAVAANSLVLAREANTVPDDDDLTELWQQVIMPLATFGTGDSLLARATSTAATAIAEGHLSYRRLD